MTKEESQGVAAEQREAEQRWCWEMGERLDEHRKQHPNQPKSSLDINVRVYEVIRAIGVEKSRTWRKVLLKIIANRDALDPVGRRLLLRKLKKRAKRERNRSIKAEQRALRFEGFVEQLDDPKQGSALNSLPFRAVLPSPWDS
jgi:hypothetical protein